MYLFKCLPAWYLGTNIFLRVILSRPTLSYPTLANLIFIRLSFSYLFFFSFPVSYRS
ncbi:uncharacterized protein BDV14DRAFT_169049 [Aspergillus stella-maris]|uniref:uncharacterized protein n=1 Tax=Aspergillus stella-maris TaxID=1810926 RepID=UPI003CCDD733